ncbi:hypothetical protein [Mycobacterium sp. SA01]|uniref:hypothetical protein n=1 Tax=Mycobacterium sp. SA01 TaxID=3238820 RepID=UPI00351B85D2
MTETSTTPPTVRRVGEWHLVTANNYQVSIGPDALVMLPRHIHPREIPDFISALTVAAAVANAVYTGNIEAAKDDDRALAQRNAYVTAGGTPAGTVRMQVAQRQSEQATIGRPKRRGRGATSAVPASAKPKVITRQQAAAARKAAAREEQTQ